MKSVCSCECWSVQIIQKMSSALGYKAASTYLSCHLAFLVSQWLDLDYLLSAFPYRLLQCSSAKQFYRWALLSLSCVVLFRKLQPPLCVLAGEMCGLLKVGRAVASFMFQLSLFSSSSSTSFF